MKKWTLGRAVARGSRPWSRQNARFSGRFVSLIVHCDGVRFCVCTGRFSVCRDRRIVWFVMHRSDDIFI